MQSTQPINTQRPEPIDRGDGMNLDIIEIFHTLQGEGPFSGQPSVFVRLAGCNLQCPGCDTQYTRGRHRVSVSEISRLVDAARNGFPRTHLVVVTGGEPFRQHLDPLINALPRDMHAQIESNGVFTPSPYLLHLAYEGAITYVVSPKTSHIHVNAQGANCFKYVLRAGEIADDGLPTRALGHKAAPFVARPDSNFEGEIWVNPMDEGDEIANRANLLAARDSALRHGYRLGIQLHKLLDLP